MLQIYPLSLWGFPCRVLICKSIASEELRNVVYISRERCLLCSYQASSMFPNVEALTIHSFDEVQSETFDDYDHWYAYNCTWNIITLRHLLCRLTTHQWCQTNSSISSTCLFCRVGLFPGLWLPFSGFFLWRFSLIGDLHIICKLLFMLQIYMPGFLVQPLIGVC